MNSLILSPSAAKRVAFIAARQGKPAVLRLSVDGGGSVSIGTTVGSFVSALNTALGGNGSASFANGVLTLSATGNNGVVVQDDATAPSSRGSRGWWRST